MPIKYISINIALVNLNRNKTFYLNIKVVKVLNINKNERLDY